MAAVETNGGLPTVSPQMSAPDDRQRIQSTPEDFGAGIARAGQQAGQAIQKTGQFFQSVQTDDAVNGAMDTVNKTLDSYRSLSGRAVLDSREQTERDVDEAFKQGREGLSSLDQKVKYDDTVRSYRQRYVAGIIASHADQAAKQYTSDTNKASMDTAMAGVANVADSDEQVGHFVDDARWAARLEVMNQGNGSDPKMVSDAMDRASRAAYKTQAETVAIKDPTRALKIIEDHKDVMGIEYPELSNRFRTRAVEQQGLGVANDAFGAVANNMASPVIQSTNGVRQAIFDQEGGKDTTPRSANGAIGPGQIMPTTFSQFAKPGEDINNPHDNRAVASRVIDDLSKKFDGDPARIAVGYFSGPGNVAPVGSPTPWIADVKDANGKSVSSYVQDINARVSTNGPALAARANVYDGVLAKTEGQPLVRQAALREVEQRYHASEIASLSNEKALTDERNARLRKYGDQIRAGSPDTPFDKDPYLSEEQVEHLHTLQRMTMQEGLQGRPGDYGDGYGKALTRIFSTGPDRIVNQEQLLPLVHSGDLNVAGYAEATKQLEAVNKPGAEGDRQLQKNFYAAARQKITRAIEGEREVIPGSEAKWNEALPAVTQALAEGRGKGMTNAELMDPANKNSVWKVLTPWLPTANQNMIAEINKDKNAAARQFDIGTVKTLDDLTAAFNRNDVTKAQAAELVRQHPEWNVTFGKSVPGPQVPTGQ